MRDDDPREPRLEAWLRPFVDDSSLWPVLAVAVGMIATNAAALLVLAFHDRSVVALGAVALLAAFAGFGGVRVVRRRRLGPIGGIVVAICSLAALEAALYVRLIEN